MSSTKFLTNLQLELYKSLDLVTEYLSRNDLAKATKELTNSSSLVSNTGSMELIYDRMLMLRLEVNILSEDYEAAYQLVEGPLNVNQLGPLTDNFVFLCQLTGWRLAQRERNQEAVTWFRYVLDVGNKVDEKKRDFCIKMLIKMSDISGYTVESLIDLLSSPYDRLMSVILLCHSMLQSVLQQVKSVEMDYKQLVKLIIKIDVLESDDRNLVVSLVMEQIRHLTSYEQEDCLVMTMHSVREQPMLAFQIFSQFVELVCINGEVGEVADLVLHLGDLTVGEGELLINERKKWLEGLTFLASFRCHIKYYDHFAESYVILLLSEFPISEAVKFIELWRQKGSVTPWLDLVVSLKSENIQDMISSLQKLVSSNLEKQEISSTLLAVWPDIQSHLEVKVIDQLVRGLAEKMFFNSLDLLAFSVKLVINREEELVSRLTLPSIQDWVVDRDVEGYFSRICWHVGLATDNMKMKHRMLLLSSQLLPQLDKAGLAARLASLPAGLSALRDTTGHQRDRLVSDMSTCLKILWEVGRSNIRLGRAVLLYRARMYLMCGQEDQVDQIMDQMTELKDISGLEVLALMSARDKTFFGDRLAVISLIAAQGLDMCERRSVAVVELLCRHPYNWDKGWVIEIMRHVQWRLGDNLQKAVRQIWNCWVKISCCEVVRDEWGQILVLLHNQVTHPTDHINCKLGQPSEPLLAKIKRLFTSTT